MSAAETSLLVCHGILPVPVLPNSLPSALCRQFSSLDSLPDVLLLMFFVPFVFAALGETLT